MSGKFSLGGKIKTRELSGDDDVFEEHRKMKDASPKDYNVMVD